MALVKAFCGFRPRADIVSKVAALPYDVYTRQEAKAEVSKEPLSFLKIDRAEVSFSDDVDTYDERVYQKAKELLDGMIADGSYLKEEKAVYYIYRLTMLGRSQTGIVACASIDDYLNHVIKKHENTREEKELDRIRHVDTLDAQTGPIFLAYRSNAVLRDMLTRKKQEEPVYSFISEDNVGHDVWVIDQEQDIADIEAAFADIESLYIADGHHRAASAVKVGIKRRSEHPAYTGKEEFNFFLSVLFPDDELLILPYHRVVEDFNGLTKQALLEKIEEHFEVTIKDQPYTPEKKGTIGMYLEGTWYRLTLHEHLQEIHPVNGLDVSVLQNKILGPILGIEDPRTDKRIDFVGGIKGLGELNRRVSLDMKLAFSMYPTSMSELFSIADADLLMPPKSTWFEPKLRSGIFIHQL